MHLLIWKKIKPKFSYLNAVPWREKMYRNTPLIVSSELNRSFIYKKKTFGSACMLKIALKNSTHEEDHFNTSFI